MEQNITNHSRKQLGVVQPGVQVLQRRRVWGTEEGEFAKLEPDERCKVRKRWREYCAIVFHVPQ